MALKILHVLDHSLPLHDGYALRSHNIVRAQCKRGWRPVALTSSKHEQYATPDQARECSIDGCRYYRTGALPALVAPLQALPLVAEYRLMAALARRLHQVIGLEQPDLLHVHSPILNALPVLRRVARQCRLPVVYELRSFWEDAAVDQGTYALDSWKYKLVRAAETWVCRQADQVAVLCQGLKDELSGRGIPAARMTVVYNGVNLDDFHACEPDAAYRQAWQLAGKHVIGFIGSFYRYEGLDLLIDAFARLAGARSDVVLLLVGGGEMAATLSARVQQHRLANRVIMPGMIPHERVPGVYGLIDVLAYPRYSIRLTELVTPLKPLEAMAMGKALVASDIGGHRELIQHGTTGLLFTPGDVSALEQALTTLLDDQACRQALARQGRAWVQEHHTWETTTAVYADMYEKALGGKRGRGKQVMLESVQS